MPTTRIDRKDSIKFFEFSDIYKTISFERRFAFAISGRINKNAKEFNNQLDYSYLKGMVFSIFSDLLKTEIELNLKNKKGYDFYESISYDGNEIGGLGKISKDTIDSKVKTPIFACEIEIGSLFLPVKVHTDVSEFPASYRDLSFSLESHDGLKKLSDLINLVSKENNLLDDYFIFDFFENKKLSILKSWI